MFDMGSLSVIYFSQKEDWMTGNNGVYFYEITKLIVP